MVNSHAGMLVPGSKESMCESARNNVSCTRSSARSILPHNEMANARRLGTVDSTWSRIAGSSFIATSLWLLVLIAQAADQIGDMRRHALIDDVVVHRAQLLTDLGLDLTAQPCLGFWGIDRRAHGISGFWLVRSCFVRFRLYCFEIGPTVFHFAIFPPFAHVKPTLGTHKPPTDRGQRPVLPMVPGFGNFFRNFFRTVTFLSVSLGNPEGEGVVPNSQAVLQHLPFLRRYARALTGSQASGDAYVAATLESLIASPDMLTQTANSRVGLYRLFTKIWGSLAVNGKPEAGDSVLAPEQHITQLTPRPRQAFLLVALEGFSEDDAAQILDCDLTTLRNLVEESGRELAAEIATDVL